MILPIVAYGHPTLKAIAQPITSDYPELETLLKDMWETLTHSEGVGLAAPQVNKSIRLFIVDGNPFYPDYPDAKDFKQVFINAELLETFGEEVSFKEGCLSLPNIYEEVMRPEKIRIKYLDENFKSTKRCLKAFAPASSSMNTTICKATSMLIASHRCVRPYCKANCVPSRRASVMWIIA